MPRDNIGTILGRAHTEYIDPFAILTKAANTYGADLKEEQRHAEAKARQDEIDERVRSEYERQQKERLGKQLFSEELRKGPQTAYKDITGEVLRQGIEDPTKRVENMTLFAKDGGGIGDTYEAGKYFADADTSDLTKALTKDEFDRRLGKQKEFGVLTEKDMAQDPETQPQMLSRVLDTMKAQGYDTSPYIDQLTTARALEGTTLKAAKDAERTKQADLLSNIAKVESKRQDKGLQYNALEAKVYNGGVLTKTQTDSIKDQEDSVSKAKLDPKGTSNKAVLDAFAEQTTNWASGIGETLGFKNDSAAVKDLSTFMQTHDISPKRGEAIILAGKFYKTTDAAMFDRPVPLVIRATSGVALGGAHHCNSLESFFAHTPGLSLAVPSTPMDVKGLIKTALRNEDPVIFLMHKKLSGARGEIGDENYFVPFGKAKTIKAGKDAAIITYGYSAVTATKAAQALEAEGISVEVIDLRTLYPIDQDAIDAAVTKFGRVVVLDEAPLFGSITAEIAATASERNFKSLKGPIVRVGAVRAPLSANPAMSEAAIPSVDQISKAVKQVMSY